MSANKKTVENPTPDITQKIKWLLNSHANILFEMIGDLSDDDNVTEEEISEKISERLALVYQMGVDYGRRKPRGEMDE